MIYGTPIIVTDDDTTDRIGIRRLVLSQMWQPSSEGLSQKEIDAQRPNAPETDTGVILVGTQTRRAAGVYKTTWTYEGIEGDGKGVTFKDRKNTIDYGFDPSFAQVPIELFWDFQNLLKNYDGTFNADESQVVWSPTLKNDGTVPAVGLSGGSTGPTIPNPMFGHSDFFRLEGVYKVRYASLTAPSQLGAGCIAKPPGEPPDIGDRDWLYAGSPYKRRGTIYDVTEIYWLSGAGGWPKPVYDITNQPDRSGALGSGGPTQVVDFV